MHCHKLHIQTVILVDVKQNPSTDKEEKGVQDNANKVKLSTFRLLNQLSSEIQSFSNTKKSKTKHSLKWGYKFFNSAAHNSKIEQYSLKDFKLRYFEEFENEVERRFEESFKAISSLESKHKSPFKSNPSDCLMRALTEILYDFTWEMPDLMSPVKGRKRNKNHAIDHEINRNYVFLFSECPKSTRHLRQFAGKKVIDDFVLLDSFMPQSLFNKFHTTHGLRLSWIDTHLYSNEVDKKSLILVEKAISHLGGKLIPLESLVCTERQCGIKKGDKPDLENDNSNQNENQNETDRISNQSNKPLEIVLQDIFPYSCVIDYFIANKNVDDQHASKTVAGVILKSNEEHFCSVELKPAIKASSTKELRSITSAKPPEPLDIVVANLHPLNRNIDHPFCVQVDISLDHVFSGSEPVNLHMCGTLKNSSIKFDSRTGQDYICIGTQSNEGSKDNGTSACESLLRKLTSRRSSLVLCIGRSPLLAVLSPLNAVSATVTVLAFGSSLKVEKSLHIKSDSSFTEEQDPVTVSPTSSVVFSGVTSSAQSTLAKCKVMCKGKVVKSSSGRHYDPRCIDKTHLPGCQPAMVNLIDKLNERISQLDFLSEDEVKTLRQLQKTYRIENQPLKPREQPVVIPQVADSAENDLDMHVHLEESNLTKQESKKGRGSMPSRGEMMVTRSRQSVQLVKDDNSEKCVTKKLEQKTSSADMELQSDFKDEEELSKYLVEMYSKALSAEDTGLIMCAQTLVMVALHYMKEQNKESPEDSCFVFLNQCIISEPAKLREKHQTLDSESQKSEKIKEYKLQIILRMECLSAIQGADQSVSENENKIEEIVMMLRTLSFLSEPTFLSEFLEKTLVDSYIHTLPQILGNIYDELMQPLPELLEAVLSPDKSMNQSIGNQSLVSNEGDTTVMRGRPGSVNTETAEPLSDVLSKRSHRKSRGRPLVHHPSLADMGSKRQIVVQNKVNKNKKVKASHKKSSAHPLKKKLTDHGQEKVVRNLFEGGKKKLERHQSVAVMEHVRKTPRKKSKGFSLLKSPKALKSPFKSPGFSKKKMVSETPAHKQRSNPIWKRLEKERRRTLSSCNVHLVEESPVKADVSKRDSPSQNKRALALVRRSFYSAGPTNRSRNLTKSFQLADRIAGRQRHHSGQKSIGSLSQSLLSQFKSPDKNSSFLLSQLMGSPTPPKGTPKKNAVTPLKVAESPSMSTRSKSPGLCLLQRNNSPSLKSGIKEMVNLSGLQGKHVGPTASMASCTPTKTESPVPKDLLMSPSHNTRSKVTSTPTRSSVRTILFMKSPEPKATSSPRGSSLTPKRFDKINSPSLKSGCDLGDTHNASKATSTHKGSSEISDRVMTCSWIDADGSVRNLTVRNENSNVTKSAVISTERTPSPRKRPKSGLEFKSPENVSPSQQILNKTPTSLNHWPRKKRIHSPDLSHDLKLTSSNTNSEADNINIQNIKDKSVDVKTSNNLEDPNILRTSSLIGSFEKEIVQSQKMSRKRSLALSPDSISSPSKRKRSHAGRLLERRDSLPISYCLHSRIVSRQSSVLTDQGSVNSSQGFDTSQLYSSQNSLDSQLHSSQRSSCSVDYFSASNDEVFLSQPVTKDSASLSQNDENSKMSKTHIRKITSPNSTRSESPIFGSGHKVKKLPSSQYLIGQDDESEPMDIEPMDIDSTEPIAKCRNSDTNQTVNQTHKISPSGRKYSPNVSTKSLMHLISSPLLKSPLNGGDSQNNSDSNTSPRIDQDSLNIRRKRMQGKSRRSLKLQN